jgi:Polysaccharide deacetylase
MSQNNSNIDFGGLVFSIDFELHWGVRDLQRPDGAYQENLLGERTAVPEMLRIFREFGIAATWATVGFLFAKSRDELEYYAPRLKPQYEDQTLSPYQERIGNDESDDPLHYAPTLIKQILATPQQEVGTHTFSHYYCLESGQTAETFSEDIRSAKKIAANYGVNLASIVFPRNQVNQEYFQSLLEAEIISYRGNEKKWMYREMKGGVHPAHVRGGRIVDTYLNISGQNLTSWDEVVETSGICNIPSSRFLRPVSNSLHQVESLRLQRILRAMEEATRSKKIFHIWTHAHNLGVNLKSNLAFLSAICREYKRLQNLHGMRSLTMQEAALLARGEA